MKIQIDLKSAACGLVLGVAAMFVMGAGEPSSVAGRYQISTGQTAIAIVDTANGKAWAYDLPGSHNYYPPAGKNNFWDAK